MAEEKDSYTYPVEGWYWYDDLDAAIAGFAKIADPGQASVTMRQARLALLQIGKLALVSAAIATMPEPLRSAAAIEWEYAATVDRTSPLVASLGPALGMADAELDALFELARTL